MGILLCKKRIDPMRFAFRSVHFTFTSPSDWNFIAKSLQARRKLIGVHRKLTESSLRAHSVCSRLEVNYFEVFGALCRNALCTIPSTIAILPLPSRLARVESLQRLLYPLCFVTALPNGLHPSFDKLSSDVCLSTTQWSTNLSYNKLYPAVFLGIHLSRTWLPSGLKQLNPADFPALPEKHTCGQSTCESIGSSSTQASQG